jgi:hypothetical protein
LWIGLAPLLSFPWENVSILAPIIWGGLLSLYFTLGCPVSFSWEDINARG